MPNQIVVFDTGKLRLMRMLVEGGFPSLDGHVTMHIFVNSMTLTPGRTLGDFVEMTLAGYAPRRLAGALDLGIDANDADTWQWPSVTFTGTVTPVVPVVAFGYYVTHDVDGELLWGQLFDTPPVWTVAGDSYALAAQLSLGACCDASPIPPFALFAVDAVIQSAVAKTFTVDAAVETFPQLAFAVDAFLAEEFEVAFAADAYLAFVGETEFQVDSVLADEFVETFTVDADLHTIPPNSFFVDALIVQSTGLFVFVDGVVASVNTASFDVDAVLTTGESRTFSVDSFLLPTPGVAILTSDAGLWYPPPGIESVNVFFWGSGGDGYANPTGAGSAGGAGGSYTQKFNVSVTPGFPCGYVVQPYPGSLYSWFHGDTDFIGVWPSSSGTVAGGGTPGTTFGGDLSHQGGSGGIGYDASFPQYGGGGGSAAGPWGDGLPGGNATSSSPGPGGNFDGGLGAGGHGANPNITTYGQDGFNPGGAGGGQANLTLPGPVTPGRGAGGMLVITWQAGIFWLDAVLKKSSTRTFTVDGLIGHPAAASTSVDACLAPGPSRTFKVESLIASRSTKIFTADSLVASRPTKTFTVGGLVASRPTKTFTATALLATRSTKTFTVDADIYKLSNLSFAAASTQYGDCGNLAAWQVTGDFSASCWIVFNDFSINYTCFGRFSDFSAQGGWMLKNNGTGAICQIGNNGESVFLNLASASGVFTAGNLYHICVTRSGSSCVLYVNGSSVATGSFNTSIGNPSGAHLLLGGGYYSSSGASSPGTIAGTLNGKGDAFRFYNIGLNSTQVAEIYGGGFGLATAGSASANLQGWWKLDDGSGSSAADSSGNGRNATLVNTPTWGIGQVRG